MRKKPTDRRLPALEELIEEVGRRGLRINNLFQLDDRWRANLTDGENFYEFGEGKKAAEALWNALSEAPERTPG